MSCVVVLSAGEFSATIRKEDIRTLGEDDHPLMLARVMEMDLTSYRYKKEYGGEGDTKLGFIAEDMPEEVLSRDGKGMDLYELIDFIGGDGFDASSRKILAESGKKRLIRLDRIFCELNLWYSSHNLPASLISISCPPCVGVNNIAPKEISEISMAIFYSGRHISSGQLSTDKPI